jgi:hypothetical protein
MYCLILPSVLIQKNTLTCSQLHFISCTGTENREFQYTVGDGISNMKKSKGIYGLWIGLFGGICLGACGCHTTDRQLEDVNKDWNKLVRASHIYPVYPLTQDLQPGDVYLVSSDIEDVRQWDENGYLKLDKLLTRLQPTNYPTFYSSSFAFETNTEANIPSLWNKDNSWTNAPTAAFPSFSFSVRSGAGFNVALPIQGIPVGLGLMETKEASGFVTIGEAYTYGIDELSLRSQLDSFVQAHGDQIQELISANADETNYLQVVTRVYLSSKVTVSMFNDSASGGNAWGGAPKAIDFHSIISTNSDSTYSNLSEEVNSLANTSASVSNLSTVLPGGTLKFLVASSRAVAMDESFPKPLVIGYLGFVVPISMSNNKSVGKPGETEFDLGGIRTVESTMRALKAQRR